MVVVDSSALIPLSWVGRLELIPAVFDDLDTTEDVRSEVLADGKPGVAALEAFLDEDASVHPTPEASAVVAETEGIATTDASVVLLADALEAPLLANDKALLTVARTHGVDGWWVTTLLLKCTKEDHLASEEATDVLYELVDEGMNLHPKVYTKVQRRLEQLDD